MNRKEANEYIFTYSGQVIDPSEPKLEQIKLIDIAYGLSNIKRYGGQTRISVLRHSLALYHCAETPTEALFALLHDAAEAYAGDIPTNIKPYLGKKWLSIYTQFERLIYSKYGVVATEAEKNAIMTLDKQFVEYEMDSRELYEAGSAIAFPCTRKLTQQEYGIINGYYKWGLTDDQLIPVFISAVRQLTSDRPSQSLNQNTSQPGEETLELNALGNQPVNAHASNGQLREK